MKKYLYLILFLSTIVYSQDKYQRVRILYNSKEEMNQIIRDIQIDHFHEKKNQYIECELSISEILKLEQAGKKFEVIINDLTTHFQKNKNALIPVLACNENTIIDPINYNTGSMAGFLTFAECMAELDEMRTLYPNLISEKAAVGTILTSENRSLQFVKISDNPDIDETEKQVLYTAVHHAREPGSMQQLIYFMWYVLENYATNTEIRNLVNNTEIFCIPIVNPDGYIHNENTNPQGGGMWRKNRRMHPDGNFGVDNNRNYSYGWGTTGITFDTSGETYCGNNSFSEPENLAIKWFCEQKKFLVAMNAHTFSSLVLYPFGNEINSPTPDDNIFNGISGEMVKYNKYVNQLAANLYPASGTSDDWMYVATPEKDKIFAFTPEVGGSFWDTPAQTAINNRDMLHANLTALRFVHNYATIDDTTPKFISTNNFAFNFSLKRLGLVENENFIVSIVPTSSNILSVGQPLIFSNLSYNTQNNDSLNISLNSNITQGETINFNVEVNNGTSIQTYPITKYYGNQTIIFNEPGNNLTQWIATTNSWNTTTSSFFTANSSITDSQNGNYLNNKNSNIKTQNTINLNNVLHAELTFYAKWSLEKGYDYTVLEISNDNGATWVPQCGKYTSKGNTNQISNQPIYDGIQNTWVKEEVDLSSYINSNILIRFRFQSDSFENFDGFYFDDLKVTVINPIPLKNKNFVFDQVFVSPNPATTTLTLNTISGVDNYKIYAVSGQLLTSEKLKFDKIEINSLSDGIYFLELSINEKKKVLKFVVQK